MAVNQAHTLLHSFYTSFNFIKNPNAKIYQSETACGFEKLFEGLRSMNGLHELTHKWVFSSVTNKILIVVFILFNSFPLVQNTMCNRPEQNGNDL